MKITYYGHSAVLVEHNGVKVIIDPFLSGNPASGIAPEDVNVDAVILTHAHDDHFGDTIEIAKANGCPVIATFELAGYCEQRGVSAHAMNTGGAYQFENFKVRFTPAFHTSSLRVGDQFIYAGEPVGIIVEMGGTTFYHAGDTALFGDMRLIGERHNIDVAALPIGDNFTMGPDDAVVAAGWLKAKHIIPIHYNTFPAIEQDAERFRERIAEVGATCHPLGNGESLIV